MGTRSYYIPKGPSVFVTPLVVIVMVMIFFMVMIIDGYVIVFVYLIGCPGGRWI